MIRISKIKFIFPLFFILISLVSIIFVALAETNQSIITDEGNNIGDNPGIALTSLIFVAVTFLLSHYMDDHDKYARQFRELQCEWYCYKISYEPSKNCKDKDTLKNCTLCRVMQNHFGIIDITLLSCFVTSIFLVTLLFMQIRTFESSLMEFIIISVDALLLVQLLAYLKQGNVIARWIKLQHNRKNSNYVKCCEENLQIIFPHIIGQMLTNMRLRLVRESKNKGNSDLRLDICSDIYVYILWIIIIVINIYFIVFKPIF